VKYLLIMADATDATDASDASDSPGAPVEPELGPVEWAEEMLARGIELGGARLRPAAEARTVRVRGGEVLVVDGPYAEAREQVAGFDLIDARDLDEAIEVAAKHPAAASGPVEIRPLWDTEAELDLKVLRSL